MKKFSVIARGFTLVELMVIVAIVAILAAIAFPSYQDYIRKSRLEGARATINDNIKMMERYYGVARNLKCETKFATQVNGTCQNGVLQPDMKNSNVSKYYDFTIALTDNSNNYVITATPKSGVYSERTLANDYLTLIFHSGSQSYAKCTSAGATHTTNNKLAKVEGCQVL